MHVSTDSFSERGGALALDSQSQETDVTFSTLGLRVSTTTNAGGLQIKPSAALGWRHAFGDVHPEQKVGFAGGDTFTLQGVPVARDAAVIEGGLDMALSDRVSLGVSYGGQISSDTKDQKVNADLTFRF